MDKLITLSVGVVVAILLALIVLNVFGLVVFATKIVGAILVVWFIVSLIRALLGSSKNE